MKQKKRGRPKKEYAIKPGDLKEDLQRFTFIAYKKIVGRVRTQAMERNISVKDLMNAILLKHFNLKLPTKRNIVSEKNIEKIRTHSNNKRS